MVVVHLHMTRIQHDSDTSANGLWWKVASKFAAHDAIASMRATHLAPVDAELSMGVLGHKGDTLAEVKGGVLCGVHALDLDQTVVCVLRSESTLVAEDGTVHMQARGSSRNHCCRLL